MIPKPTTFMTRVFRRIPIRRNCEPRQLPWNFPQNQVIDILKAVETIPEKTRLNDVSQWGCPVGKY